MNKKQIYDIAIEVGFSKSDAIWVSGTGGARGDSKPDHALLILGLYEEGARRDQATRARPDRSRKLRDKLLELSLYGEYVTWLKGSTLHKIDWTLWGGEPAASPTVSPRPAAAPEKSTKLYSPSCEDVNTAYRRRCRPGDEVDPETLLDWVEEDLKAAGKRLVPGWRDLVREHCL